MNYLKQEVQTKQQNYRKQFNMLANGKLGLHRHQFFNLLKNMFKNEYQFVKERIDLLSDRPAFQIAFKNYPKGVVKFQDILPAMEWARRTIGLKIIRKKVIQAYQNSLRSQQIIDIKQLYDLISKDNLFRQNQSTPAKLIDLKTMSLSLRDANIRVKHSDITSLFNRHAQLHFLHKQKFQSFLKELGQLTQQGYKQIINKLTQKFITPFKPKRILSQSRQFILKNIKQASISKLSKEMPQLQNKSIIKPHKLIKLQPVDKTKINEVTTDFKNQQKFSLGSILSRMRGVGPQGLYQVQRVIESRSSDNNQVKYSFHF